MNNEADKFWSKVNKDAPNGCWEWEGAKLRGGYGNLNINHRTVQAHRYSWEIHNGDIPAGIFVLHHCDNPSCVNPEHLFLGTNQDNATDRVNKNRSTKGEAHPHHKMTNNDIIKIREMFATKLYSMHKLAKIFHLSYSETNAILHKRTWRHVE